MSEFKRQHPVAAITRVIDLIRQNLVTLIILLFLSSTRSDGYFWYFLAAGFVIAFIGGFFSWFTFKFRLEDDELQIHKGIFVKSKLYLSKERIQVIDITEGLLQRIFGLVQVEIKTAGSGTQSATISAISREEADELRRELRKDSTAAEADPEAAFSEMNAGEHSEASQILATWKLSKRDLVFAAFTSGNFGLIASILGAISGQLDQFINDETIDYIYEMAPGYSNVTVLITLIAAVIFISWLLSFLGVIFRYSDFKLEKTQKELIISSGLVERKHVTIPFNRIQAIRFVEGIFRQPFGYGMIYVESAGFDMNNNERSIVLAPFISSSAFSGFLNTFLPAFSEPEFHISPRKKSIFRYIIKPNYLLLTSIIAAWFVWENWWILLLFIPVFALLGYQRYRDAALAISEDMLRMRFRILARTTAIMFRHRIQKLEMRANPFQRRKKLKNLIATAASGAQGIDFEIKDLNESDAFEAFNWITTEESSEGHIQRHHHTKSDH